ncbi:MAG: hypothetical protein A2140_09390 [Candidatus Muproteobacteria bacterium RBG_16_62_13]|uniref:Uncharacterized protein n=1 Tax=Candidatus Muproteobacteria bacterium RBG_16_62_13 TaxID=1817756 RepID=A0A1F6SZU4_9PROT|nr:MAG: hypothetical protein A2140_09390 [Candidatus Muproteobacteria bacterium RBG_16_62_13]
MRKWPTVFIFLGAYFVSGFNVRIDYYGGTKLPEMRGEGDFSVPRGEAVRAAAIMKFIKDFRY